MKCSSKMKAGGKVAPMPPKQKTAKMSPMSGEAVMMNTPKKTSKARGAGAAKKGFMFGKNG